MPFQYTHFDMCIDHGGIHFLKTAWWELQEVGGTEVGGVARMEEGDYVEGCRGSGQLSLHLNG